MKTILLVSLLLAVVACQRLLKVETLEKVKAKASWESYDWDENPFRDMTHDQVQSLFGTELLWNEGNINMLIDNDDHEATKDLPKEFDSRKQWPDCVFEVRSQDHCGSCWAFSGTSALQDRFCIASEGKIKVILSPQDSVSCDTKNHACHGGLLDATWEHFEKVGVVSEECFPYVSGPQNEKKENFVPHCPHGTCENGAKYTKYRAVAGQSKSLSCPSQIKQELHKNGPVQTGFMVFEDFMHYKNGIYEFTHGQKMGGHAVKIIGWGEENGVEFWIAQNSWGPQWGENGFFRIKMGECMFDENAYVGQANVKDFTPNRFLF